MKVNLILSDIGPSLWMLGRPRQILVHLTDKNPGPVEVDFANLDHELQKQILLGLKARNITSDISYDDLFAFWTRSKIVAPPTPDLTDAVKAHLKAQQEKLEEEARLKRQNKIKDAQLRMDERCKYILSKTIKALKVSVSKDDNLFFLRRMLQLEQEGKNRKNAVLYIKQRISTVERKEREKANKDKELPIISQATNPSPVVESKRRENWITPEMLIQSAMKKE